MGGLLKTIAKLVAPFSGFLPIAAVVAAVLAGLGWMRHEIAASATAKADAQCERRIASNRTTQDKEDEAKAHDAEDAADRVARADTRAALERVCRGDPACRERQN